MKIKLLLLTLLFALCTSANPTNYADNTIKLQKTTQGIKKAEYLYEIKNNEIIVNDNLITLFAFSKDGISASYRNKTDKKKKPRYTFKVYNSYGMLIGVIKLGDNMFGSTTYMAPGAVSSEKIYLTPFPLKEILMHSKVVVPTDILEMKWVVISETNSK